MVGMEAREFGLAVVDVVVTVFGSIEIEQTDGVDFPVFFTLLSSS